MIGKIFLVLVSFFLTAGIWASDTTSTEKVAVSRKEIVSWIQAEWQVPSTLFDQTEEKIKKELSEEEDSVKTTIKVLDLAVKQARQKAGMEKKKVGAEDLQPLISNIIAKYKGGTGWGEMAKEAGISGGASELNYRASAIQYGEVPGPKPPEVANAVPAIPEDQIMKRLDQEFHIPAEVYQQVKAGIPADESSNTLKILVLAIYQVDFSGKGGNLTPEERTKKILAAATKFTDLHYKGNEGWGNLSAQAGFPSGGDVNKIKAQIVEGKPIQWPPSNK